MGCGVYKILSGTTPEKTAWVRYTGVPQEELRIAGDGFGGAVGIWILGSKGSEPRSTSAHCSVWPRVVASAEVKSSESILILIKTRVPRHGLSKETV